MSKTDDLMAELNRLRKIWKDFNTVYAESEPPDSVTVYAYWDFMDPLHDEMDAVYEELKRDLRLK